ncbi:hypothetical protein LV716_13980 [Flagellimonas sp. HMM57]|uniref:glycoside hydrolase family 2 TIM barrel-domain containing protein n=1 Tax=unclassified Flagellimonas TaxID=2644544 RepID=UPI0013D581B6|nr:MULTISPECIES: glycoside hydrolase family 2 TIM barrel-domain containing protein [unclassified Flagellimonas]UII75356.1 hypothetical protein LV716_13980 [Flagellimonas sp. HMM57]
MKKSPFLILISVLLFSCNSNEKLSGNDTLSLNGDWKFNTIYGEGSNYMNIRETDSDLVIDNTDANIKILGDWRIVTEGERDTYFYGKDYVMHNFTNTDLGGGNKADTSYVRFYPKFKKSGFYEVFSRYPFASNMTAQYNIKHVTGITTKYFNQRVFCNEWNSLGIYEFGNSDEDYVELTAIVSGEVAADAVMFREISEEKYIKAQEEPKRVFLSDFDDSNWYDLKVPGHWGMINDFSNYTGIGWYRKAIELPENWEKGTDDRYYLKFEGVYHLSKVYINGKFIGKNRGGFTPFEFDVTEALNFNGTNVIAVQADNSAIVSATWNWGGIIRDVTLTKNKDIRLDYQYIHADPDLSSGMAQVKLKVRVENNSNAKRTVNVHAQLMHSIEIGTLDGSLEIDPHTSRDIDLETTLDADKVQLWHFDHPKLYSVVTTVSEGGVLLDQRTDDFGIRKIELTDSKMLLNGEPVRLAGYNRVSESRFWGSSEPLEVLEEDVDLMKEAGANFMRIMHGNQNKKLFELCDRKGIMLFEEVNVRDLANDEFRLKYYPLSESQPGGEGVIDPKSEDEEVLMLDEPYVMLKGEHGLDVMKNDYFLPKYWLKKMIERDINHPSIIGWSVGNELNNHYEYGRAAIEYVKKELDPYRLVTCVSNSGQQSEYTPDTDPNTFSDLIMHNMYPWQGEPQDVLDTLRSKWPNKPIFISEFGFGPLPSTGLDVDQDIISEWMEYYRGKNDFVVGTSLWTFNDYRSAYAGTTAEENRVWGVITSWRKKRRLFNRLRREHAPIKDIEVSHIDFEKKTADVRIPIKGREDYPSHTMKGYTLAYQFKNTDGEMVFDKKLRLPILKPEDGEWKGQITWDGLPEQVLDLTLNLVTPTYHSRFNKTLSFQKAITPEIKEIIPGKYAVRVLFDNVPNATEYYVAYSNGDNVVTNSNSTINHFIDIDGLSEDKSYSFKLYAVNDKGVSNPSTTKEVITSSKELPPTIWDSFITDNKLVIGYTSDFDDGNYTVEYGTSKANLNKTFVSNVRGMLSIDLEGEAPVFFRIKRETANGESNWSEIEKAEQKKTVL